MDTNLVMLLLQQLAAKQAEQSSASLQIWQMVLYALGPLLGGVSAYFASLASKNAERSKIANEKTAESVEKIHVAVNSTATAAQVTTTAALAQIEQLKNEILRISKEKATLDERLHAIPVVIQSPVPVPVAVIPMQNS